MKGEVVAKETVEGLEEDAGTGARDAAGVEEGEFKITVRKLELPVRPRGVLAE